MNIFKRISRAFKTPSREEAEKDGDWATLLKFLGECQFPKDMDDLVQAIVRVGDKKAAPALVNFILEWYQNGESAAEKANALSHDPELLLLDKLRRQQNITTVGYAPEKIQSPINDWRVKAGIYYARGHKALDALVGLKAMEEVQALMDNPATQKYWDNFADARKRIEAAPG